MLYMLKKGKMQKLLFFKNLLHPENFFFITNHCQPYFKTYHQKSIVKILRMAAKQLPYFLQHIHRCLTQFHFTGKLAVLGQNGEYILFLRQQPSAAYFDVDVMLLNVQTNIRVPKIQHGLEFLKQRFFCIVTEKASYRQITNETHLTENILFLEQWLSYNEWQWLRQLSGITSWEQETGNMQAFLDSESWQ